MNASDEKIIQFAKNPAAGPNPAVIGGGTGLATMLRGLKLFTEKITAIGPGSLYTSVIPNLLFSKIREVLENPVMTA